MKKIVLHITAVAIALMTTTLAQADDTVKWTRGTTTNDGIWYFYKKALNYDTRCINTSGDFDSSAGGGGYTDHGIYGTQVANLYTCEANNYYRVCVQSLKLEVTVPAYATLTYTGNYVAYAATSAGLSTDAGCELVYLGETNTIKSVTFSTTNDGATTGQVAKACVESMGSDTDTEAFSMTFTNMTAKSATLTRYYAVNVYIRRYNGILAADKKGRATVSVTNQNVRCKKIFEQTADGRNIKITAANVTDDAIDAAKTELGATDNTLVYVVGTYTGSADNVIVKGSEGAEGVCSKLVIRDYSQSEPNAFTCSEQFTADVTEYERANTDEWGAVCLPYAPENTEDIVYYELTGVSDTKLTFTKVENPQANTPYLYRNTSGGNFVASPTNVTVPVTPATLDGSSAGGFILKGAEHPTSVVDGTTYTTAVAAGLDCVTDAGAYYYKDCQFHKLNGRFNMQGFRAYLTTTNAKARESVINLNIVDGETTGITFVEHEEAGTVDIIFDINGRRQNADYKGIGIVNGKKIIK